MNFLAVFLGGGIGSILRYLVCLRFTNHWGIMLINILGAFFIGCAFEYCHIKASISREMQLFIMTGLLGGFTTFSTYLMNFAVVLDENKYMEAFCYLSLSVIVGIGFLYLGMKLVDLVYA